MAEKPMNKAIQVREALGLSTTEAGNLFIGGNHPYRAWEKWEKSGKWRAPTEKTFNIILTLKMAEDHKTKNCHGALKLVLNLLENDELE